MILDIFIYRPEIEKLLEDLFSENANAQKDASENMLKILSNSIFIF